jgi:hypothetical protein
MSETAGAGHVGSGSGGARKVELRIGHTRIS